MSQGACAESAEQSLTPAAESHPWAPTSIWGQNSESGSSNSRPLYSRSRPDKSDNVMGGELMSLTRFFIFLKYIKKKSLISEAGNGPSM